MSASRLHPAWVVMVAGVSVALHIGKLPPALPVLREALGMPVSATLLKGRGNYLCLHRFEIFREGVELGDAAGGALIESGDRVLLPMLTQWARTTDTGDRAELRDRLRLRV